MEPFGDFGCQRGGMPLEFAVGYKLQGKSDHVVIEAEDALVAALKVKLQYPGALITYSRRANKRGDARHPTHALKRQLD
jgi:hypothetical protein